MLGPDAAVKLFADGLSGIRVLYCDERVVAIDKPSGMLSVPGRGPDLQDCLTADVQRQFGAALVVHRLDRDTSGVIVFARDIDAQRELSQQFERREVVKRYVAVVAGRVAVDEGVVSLPLAKDFVRPPRHRVDYVHGREAVTQWRVIGRGADQTRLELCPLTGRSHQLRVHLAELGHPILGDPLYALAEVQAAAPRLMLHAESLTLCLPGDGPLVTFFAQRPF